MVLLSKQPSALFLVCVVTVITFLDSAFAASVLSTPSVVYAETAFGVFGRTQLCGCDFIGDNTADDCVFAAPGLSAVGVVHVFFGWEPSDAVPVSTANVTLRGSSTSEQFGISMACGDIWGDARDELVIGAKDFASKLGRVHVFTDISGVASQQNVTIDGVGTLLVEFGAAIALVTDSTPKVLSMHISRRGDDLIASCFSFLGGGCVEPILGRQQ